MSLAIYLILLAFGYGSAVAATENFSIERSGWSLVASATFVIGIILLAIFDVTSIRWFMWIISVSCAVSGLALLLERIGSRRSGRSEERYQPRRQRPSGQNLP